MRDIEIIFGEVVRRKRQKLDVSQEAFARMAKVHRTYMSQIERGKVQVSIGIAHQIATALEIPLSKLWREIEKRLEA